MSSTPQRTSSSPAGFTRIGPSRPAAGAGAGSSGGQRQGAGSTGPARPAGAGGGAPSGGAPRPGGTGPRPGGTGPRPGGSGPGRPGPQGGGGQRSGGGNRSGGPAGKRGGGGKQQQRRPETPKEEVKEKEEAIELEGVIAAVLAGTMFRVKLKNGHEVLAHISGKMRKKFIRLVIGDGVKLEMSPYDMDKARIVYRL